MFGCPKIPPPDQIDCHRPAAILASTGSNRGVVRVATRRGARFAASRNHVSRRGASGTATELLFIKYMIDNLKADGRCGVIVPEGVLFGFTGAQKELRRMLMQNHRVEAVLSLPGGVFQLYSGVKTSVLAFTRGGGTQRVMFLHASNDGFKLDANHEQPIEADDLPGLIAAFNSRDEMWADWQGRDQDKPWTENWWFAEATTIESQDWNLSASRYRRESREAIEHRNPRELLAELREETAAILSDIDALTAELGGRAA